MRCNLWLVYEVLGGIDLKKLMAVPAAIGFILLFLVNFLFAVCALLFTGTGLLASSMGLLYTLGFIRVISDLSPEALAFFGLFLIFSGLFLAMVLSRLAPFCLRLAHKAINSIRGTHEYRLYRYKKAGFLLIVFGVLAIGCASATFFFQKSAVDEGFCGSVAKERLEFDKVRYITVSTNNLDYEIKHTDGDKIIVEYINENPMLVRQSDENYLKLIQDDSFTFTLFAREQFSYKLTIYLPTHDYRELYLSSGEGDITLYSTASEFSSVRTGSGDITLFEATGKIDAQTLSGNIACDYLGFINSASFSTDTGDILIAMPDYSGVDLSFETITGYFTSDFFNREYFYEQGAKKLSRDAPLTRNLYIKTQSGHFMLMKKE